MHRQGKCSTVRGPCGGERGRGELFEKLVHPDRRLEFSPLRRASLRPATFFHPVLRCRSWEN